MKVLKLVVLGLSLYFLLSCSQNSQKRINENMNNASSPANIEKVQNKQKQENFYSFLEMFNRDESFQLKRIVFPITVLTTNITEDGMEMENETISKYDWELLDLTYDSTYVTREYDKYEQMISFRNDSAIVSLRGIDNGIYADYFFKLIDNKWFLVTLDE
ncbi:MAG: DUF4348 domain-containing protein [Dysgonamonadaceae bacterium]|jgi:hypothetical protein|nr:DUF4348 domain-containing protein [Dysgonamonadaceae bacterium]MDD3309296.1 DUF4348 domain-containing protein [Dysgonamonadaceae bacterium]MDD3900636.1 DUF4348 domain-containing protein [Dysgonamonadaceae bacterium]MDD4399096.1 DUF4348 domain-containing protein [Dysgonamonadaceae bacterium]MEA5081477.1 DUF4348 domain-containing protein [Dysgonamonadaceae bacterium]